MVLFPLCQFLAPLVGALLLAPPLRQCLPDALGLQQQILKRLPGCVERY